MPDAVSIAGANEAGVWADLETLGVRKLIANASKYGKSVDIKVPIFDKDGNKKKDEDGNFVFKDVTYDFKGYSDADATREDMKFGGEAADYMAKTMLEVQQKYGKDFVKQRLEELKAADPTGYEEPSYRLRWHGKSPSRSEPLSPPEETFTGAHRQPLRRCRLVMPGSGCANNAWPMPPVS